MDTKSHQVFLEIARRTSNFYAGRCWWADKDDVQSVAYLAMLEFFHNPPPSFDADRADSTAYARAVASRHGSRWCLTESSPVSAPERSRDRLAGVTRVSVTADDLDGIAMHGRFSAGVAELVTEAIAYDLEADTIAREAMALVPQLHAQLRERLYEIFVGIFPDEERSVAEACIDVLAEDTRSSEAADAHDVPVKVVYRRTERLKTRAVGDATVRDLLLQIRDRRRDIQ